MKRFGLWLFDWYNYIFDHKINPLRHIPDPTTRFFLMFYLSVAWSGAFALWAGSWYYFGGSVYAHLILLAMFFITIAIFVDAERKGHVWLIQLRNLEMNSADMEQQELFLNASPYVAQYDYSRLKPGRDKVFKFMGDDAWHTLSEISEATGRPEASVSAYLRDFRKEKFGSHIVDRRARSDRARGLWEYKLIRNNEYVERTRAEQSR